MKLWYLTGATVKTNLPVLEKLHNRFSCRCGQEPPCPGAEALLNEWYPQEEEVPGAGGRGSSPSSSLSLPLLPSR